MVLLTFLLLISSASAATNVVLLTIDSCHADRIGVYGGPAANTPNIDGWAGTAAVFKTAYSTSAWTAPGLVSILTGLYPAAHGVNTRDQTGSPEMATLLKLFAARGFSVPNLTLFSFVPYFSNLGLPPPRPEYFGRREPQTLLNWLRTEGSEGPFFVWFHTTLLHLPYNLGLETVPRSRAELEQSPGLRAVLGGSVVPRGSVDFEGSDRKWLLKLYDGELRRLDVFFGQLLETLEQLRLKEETLIVLTADHGEELLDHGFVGHASTSLAARLYEEHTRIPLIISLPGTVAAGEVEDPVSQVDIAPTILTLFGQPVPSIMQGHDLFGEIPRRALFLESIVAGNLTSAEQQDTWIRGVRRGPIKYLTSGELYDLSTDPGETINLAADRPDAVAELHSEIDGWLTESLQLRRMRSRAPKANPAAGDPCPVVSSPTSNHRLNYATSTGAIRVHWRGDLTTRYAVQYDIGQGAQHVEGTYEVLGNVHVLGPYSEAIWNDLTGWNPFRFRVSPKGDVACWSEWARFEF